jgi:hypothetical protein
MIRPLGKTYGEYYLQEDLEGRRKLLKRLVGSLHLKPATRQRIRSFDMERIPDRWKLDPVLADAWIPEDGKIEIEPGELARVWGAEEPTPT